MDYRGISIGHLAYLLILGRLLFWDLSTIKTELLYLQ